MEKLLTVKEAAEFLNFHPAHVRRLLRVGKIAGVKPTGGVKSSWRIERSALMDFLRSKHDRWFKIQRRTSDVTEKRYYTIFINGEELAWAGTAEEAVAKARQLGAHADNTQWPYKKRDLKSFEAKTGPSSTIGRLMVYGRADIKSIDW
jgi:excisionase family DNA binding protein